MDRDTMLSKLYSVPESERRAKAIDLAIEKYEWLRRKVNARLIVEIDEINAENCALCELYVPDCAMCDDYCGDDEDRCPLACAGCPIHEKHGKCESNLWSDVFSAVMALPENRSTDRTLELIDDFIKMLEDLKGESNDNCTL